MGYIYQINKIIITAEAEFDYEKDLIRMRMPKNEIKKELEEYIDNMRLNDKLQCDRYFRVKYYCEKIDQYILFYIYKAEKFGTMQIYRLCGVSSIYDWNEAIEEDGKIRNWLETRIEDLPDDDWVVSLRCRQEEQKKLMENYDK